MRLHFSIGGYDYRRRLLDFVKISLLGFLKTFLHIMCIDAPESTTESRSSSLRFDTGRNPFPEGEKNMLI